jgi:hypothetical protein
MTSYLKLITDELLLLYQDGIQVEVVGRQDVNLVRVALLALPADLPARAKCIGMPGATAFFGCLYCLQQFKTVDVNGLFVFVFTCDLSVATRVCKGSANEKGQMRFFC